MMLEATRKALAKTQTAAHSNITAAAGTLAGEQQRRAAAEAAAGEALEQARAAEEALAEGQRAVQVQLERVQERVEAAEKQLDAARVCRRSLPPTASWWRVGGAARPSVLQAAPTRRLIHESQGEMRSFR